MWLDPECLLGWQSIHNNYTELTAQIFGSSVTETAEELARAFVENDFLFCGVPH